jgi:hypothetical protein
MTTTSDLFHVKQGPVNPVPGTVAMRDVDALVLGVLGVL